VPSTDKLRRITGWQPVTSLDETIDQIIEYYRERNHG